MREQLLTVDVGAGNPGDPTFPLRLGQAVQRPLAWRFLMHLCPQSVPVARLQPQDHPDPHGIRGKVNRGKAWFAEKDGKLIGYVDDGLKCDSEVKLLPDGFDMETCSVGDKRFVRSGEEFIAKFGSYTYTIRPTR